MISRSHVRPADAPTTPIARLLCGLLAIATLLATPAAAQERVEGAVRSAPVTPFVFDGDLRDLPPPRAWQPGDPLKEVPRRFYPKPGMERVAVEQPGPDPLVAAQRQAAVRRGSGFTTPSRNFPGLGFTGVNPPDTVGDVGPAHYIQIVNSGGGGIVNVYDKAEPTPNLVTSFSLDSLGSGVCASGFGDGIVLWDRAAQRWMLSEFSGSGNNLCVYVSQTADPVSGGWYAYGFTAPSFPDYPKYGVWPTDANGGAGSYIVTANDGGPGIYALDRGAMLTGAAATYQRMSIPGLPGFGFEAPTPADLDGPDAPPTSAPAIIMRHRDTESHSGPAAPGDLLEMWSFDVDWNDTGNSVLNTLPSIDVADFDSSLCGLTSFSCFPQPGTGTRLDPLREVIMFRLQYFNFGDHESLVGNFVVDVDGADTGGLRWFELRSVGGGAWTLFQEGTYSPDDTNRWMAASAMDSSGNIAIAYNVSSTSVFPGLRYTGREDGDPLGVMTQPETVIHAGTASNSSNRYGDYSAMNLDPEDDCVFWFTGMDNLSSSWRTQIASFRFDACGCELFPLPLDVAATANGDNRIDVDWNDSELETVVEYLVQRSRNSGGPYETIAVVPDTSIGIGGGPGYVYQDLDVSGSITYYYNVVASDGGACESATALEASATATGPCTLAPLFDGLASVSTPFQNTCTLELDWSAGTSECGGSVLYNVYRSSAPGVQAVPGNLIFGNVGGTSVTDVDGLVSGTPYYYLVRAVDTSNAVGETNDVEIAGVPEGPLTTGTWFDDAGDTGMAKMVGESPWQIDPIQGVNGSAAYKTGSYGNNLCRDLQTPELRLGSGSMLTFMSQYDIESSWDKGEVQISIDGGGSWQRLEVGYPGSSSNAADACGLPTGTYFTGRPALAYAQYGADLSAYANQDVIVRFLFSSDTSVNGQGWWIDDITITQVDVPGTCSTGSACADNPVVDVRPDGPLTACLGTVELSADTFGGSGDFEYQWLRDGQPVAGANGPTYTPDDPGQATYNVEVRAATCGEPARDGLGTTIDAADTPFFDGVQSAVDAQGSSCGIDLGWNPAGSYCPGPLTYYVFRDTAPGVVPTADNLVASGIDGTAFTDDGALVFGDEYYYMVRALDRSTGRFDANTIEVSAVPTGPGTGLQTLLFETFESAASFDAWTPSIRPQNRDCGNWGRGSLSTLRPTGGSGFFAVTDSRTCGPPIQETTLTSPAVDLAVEGVLSVTLEHDLYFNSVGGSETAFVEVWDGASWLELWTGALTDTNAHQTFDVTAWAAGNPAFQVRYRVADADGWLSVDNVEISADIQVVCETFVGPPPAPDGAAGSTPLRGARLDPAGSSLQVDWDATSCTAVEYNLLYGGLDDVATYALSGSECAIGSGGSFTWNGVPGGDLWFLVVGTDGSGTESSWGRDSLLGERNGVTASGECSTVGKSVSGTCP
jgi:hypothetical protein